MLPSEILKATSQRADLNRHGSLVESPLNMQVTSTFGSAKYNLTVDGVAFGEFTLTDLYTELDRVGALSKADLDAEKQAKRA